MRLKRAWLFVPLLISLACGREALRPVEPDDTYLAYLRQAPEHRRVRQDPALTQGRWDTWLYMPWRYRWHIGTDRRGGEFCRDYGINGGVMDHGAGPLDWLERWGLRFYNDHTAGKGSLFLMPAHLKGDLRDPRAVRPRHP